MQKLFIEESKNGPQILFDPEANNYSVTGRSFPENAIKFYEPVFDWLESFSPPPNAELNFNFELYYISSSSLISLLEVLRKINNFKINGTSIKINWRYDDDDDDMRKIGEDFMNVLGLPFEFIEN
ncbi:MAG: hypothetical protein COA57_09295 [Flavobacteriales bacterium]|nr:MAG: hypothetical protein COA57_09295 [Flavobacteriales bacterium]